MTNEIEILYMKTKPHFTALLTYASTEEGGKTAPVSSGDRPGFKFPFDEKLFTGIQKFAGTELVFPGDSVHADITLLNPEQLTATIYEGMDFDFYEGDKLTGHGTVTALY